MRKWDLPEREGYVIVDDPESGALHYITQAEWDMRQEMFQRMLEKIGHPPLTGTQIIIYSTPADDDYNGKDFKKLWEDNTNDTPI